MIHFILMLIAIVLAVLLYVKGECETKWLGKSNKNWKLTLGIPIGILGALATWTWIPLLCILTYLIAAEMPYGENHWWTKLIGKQNAIIVCGVSLGLASIPILGFFALPQALISGGVWYYLFKKDGVINEPWVAILRALSGTCLL